MTMVGNCLKRVVRMLQRHSLYSAINIIGLSIGLAACLLMAFFVAHELSYDRHWLHEDRIYRLNTTFDLPGRDPYTLSVGSALALPALQADFPAGIEAGTRARSLELPVRIEERSFTGSVAFVDEAFTAVFDLETVVGNLEAALGDVSGIALSEATALAWFEEGDALGRTLALSRQGRSREYRVEAIYRAAGGNTILDLPALARIDAGAADADMTSWTRSPVATYLLLAPGADAAALNAGMDAFADRHADISAMQVESDVRPSRHLRFDIRPLAGLYLDAGFEDVQTSGDRTAVLAFSVIALLVLLVACINFIILSTARASGRAREVAVRKMAGSSRLQLIRQFFLESLVLVVLAVLVAVAGLELLLPLLESMTSRELSLSVGFTELAAAGVVLLGVVGLAGGLYPAFILSRFTPAQVLKTQWSERGQQSLGLRNLLMVFQFGVSIALIIATSVIFVQMRFLDQRDAGFDGRKVLVLDDLFFRAEVNARRELLKQEMERLPMVASASLSGHHPLSDSAFARTSHVFSLENRPGENFIINGVIADEDFFATYGIRVAAGRTFTEQQDNPSRVGVGGIAPGDITLGSLVLNQSAARRFGFAGVGPALGRIITLPSQFPGVRHRFSVVGVVEDSQYYSLRAEPRPEVYIYQPGYSEVMSLRFRGSAGDMLAAAREVWGTVMGDAGFAPLFVEDLMAEAFRSERVEAALLVSFSFLAVVIACLGLYGSSAFAVERRTREIAIRKVVGARIRQIVALLLWQFSGPVLAANAVAWPLALWAMLAWLQRFPYRIDVLLLLPLCVLAGMLALLIAWLVVGSTAARAASARLVLTLKYE